jgi:hypothetical protein
VAADHKKLDSYKMDDVATCVTYIRGVLDGYTVGVTTAGDAAMACDLSDAVTMKQVALVVLHYGRDNPADPHFRASIVTIKA